MTPMTAPMMNPGMAGSGNILAGLDQKMIKKIFNDVTTSVSDTLSQHAVEAVNQGVPYGHILDQILKMAPVSAGMKIGQDMAAGGGGKPPDNGMGQNNSQFRPPQGPQPGVKNDQSQSGAVAAGDNTTVAPTQQTNGQTPQVDANTILSQLLATMQSQGQGGQQFKMPSSFGGLIQPSAQDQVLLTQAAQNQQAMRGQTPMQIGDLQKIIAEVGGKQMAANEVPLSQEQKVAQGFEERKLQAAGFTAQSDILEKKIKAFDDNEQNLQKQLDTYEKLRGPLNKLKGGPSKEMETIQKNIFKVRKARAQVYEQLAKHYGDQPNFSGGSGSLPSKSEAPKGATGWDSDKGKWVY